MATTVDAISAGSNLTQGQGTNSLTFTLPNAPQYVVQSVVATVDNSAGGATTATLTYADTSGVVIAKRRQGETITAGATTTATWALRLAGSDGDGIRFDRDNVGGSLQVETTGAGGVEVDVHNGASFTTVLDGPAGGFYVYAPFVYYDVGGGHYRLLNTDLFDVQATAVSLSVGVGGVTTGTAGQIADTADSVTVDVSTSEAHTVVGSFIVNAGDIELDGLTTVHGGNFEVTIPNGGATTFFDHNANPIFRIDENGDLHGKTGKSLVFDL